MPTFKFAYDSFFEWSSQLFEFKLDCFSIRFCRLRRTRAFKLKGEGDRSAFDEHPAPRHPRFPPLLSIGQQIVESGTVREVLALAPGDEPSEQVDPPDQTERSVGTRPVVDTPVLGVL